MSGDDGFDYNGTSTPLPLAIAYLWSVLNYSTVFDWAYSVEGPFSELAVWVAWTFVICGAIELVMIALVILVIVFGGLWLLAGKTS